MGITVPGALEGGQRVFENAPLGDSAAFEQALARAKPNQTAASPRQSAAQQAKQEPAGGKTHQGGGNWLTRGLGLLQAGVGVAETVGGAAFGVATAETGIGAVAGGAVALHGLDDIQAGVRQAVSGNSTENFTQQAASSAAEKLGASPQAAMLIGMGVDMAAGGAFGGGEKAAVKGLEEGAKLAGDGGKILKGATKLEKGLEDAGKAGETLAKSERTAVKAEEAVAAKVARSTHGKNAIPAGTIDRAFAGALDEFPGGVPPKILNPKLAEKSHQISNGAYAVTYSGISRTPLVSSEHLTKESIEQAANTGRRTNDFRADLRLPADQRAELSDYKGYVNVDRGHMAPHGDMPAREAGSESFLLSNMVPQAANQNEGVWERIESGVRAATGAGDAADAGRDIYVATGPAFVGNELQSLNGRVLIPTDTWKAVYIPEEGKMGVYWVPNKNTVTPKDIEKISVNELQRRIGIDVFPSIKDPALRNQAEVPAIAEQGRFGGRIKQHDASVNDLTKHS